MVENFHYTAFKIPWHLLKGHHGRTQAVNISEGDRENFLITVLGGPNWAMLSSICCSLMRESWLGMWQWGGSHGCSDHAIMGSKTLASKNGRGLAWDLSCLTFLSVPWRRQWSVHSSSLQMSPSGEGPAAILEGRVAFQRDPSRREKRTKKIFGKFSKEKSQVLPRGNKHPCCSPGWGGTGWGAALQELPWWAAEHGPALCPGRRDSQQPPGLY